MNDNMKIKYFDEELEVYDERRVVNKNTYSITLNYVPSPTRPLTVENGRTILTETNGTPNANQYVLDRENGLLLFNQAMKGKVMTINYSAIGLWCISADKVYTNVDNKGKIVETLEDLMKENRQAIESIKTVGDASTVITQLQANIDSVTGLVGNIAEGSSVNEELTKSITSGKGTNTTLTNTISSANNKINEMNTWVNQHGDIVNLDNRVDTVETEIPKINEQLEQNINYGILSKSTFDGITKKENIFSVLGGIDSLTNGAGTSNNNYGYYLERQLWNNYGFGGYGYVGFQNNSISQMGSWNLSGFKTLETTDQSQYPGKYSFDNKGCYADNASNGYINFNFKNKNHTRAKVIYLKQPNGGTFNFSWVMSTKSELINTSSDTFELGVTELSELNNNAQYKGVSCSNCNGKLLIFGVYLYNEKGAIFTRLGKGGDKLINHAKTDDVFRGKWLEVLNPDIYLFNGGANDKDDWNGETYLSYLTKYLTPFISNDVHIVCIRCNDISGDNNWNEIFEPILEKFVKDNRLDYISDKKILGDYEFAMSNGYMLEGIHPSELGNKKRANFYSSFLNLPTVNFNNAISSESSELAYQYENKLTEKYLKVLNGTTSIIYKLGISNAYTIGLLTLNVIGQRNGSNHMSEKTYKIAINNGTVPNQVTSIGNLSVINNYEYHSGVNPTVDFTLGVNLVDNLLEISISPNTGTSDMNFYIKGNIVMTYLTVKGQCVWEN